MPDVPLKPWTVLAYIVADHSHLAPEDVPPHIDKIAQEEVNEILYHAPDDCNVAVQVDFTFDPGVLRVISTGDGREQVILPETGAARTETFKRFIRAVAERCPAERYMLLLWGHGLGPIGFFSDATGGDIQSAGDQTLSLIELEEVLEYAAGSEGFKQPLDLLLAKSCSVATIEAAWQFRSHVRWMIASQAAVPLKEWSYGQIFHALLGYKDPPPSLSATATRLLDAVDRHYRFPISRPGQEEVPYSLIRPASVESLQVPMQLLAAALRAADPQSPSIRAAIDRARRMPIADAALLDVAALCDALKEIGDLAGPAKQVLDALNAGGDDSRLVLGQRPAASAFNGVGIFYFPPLDLRSKSFANHVTTFDYQELDSSTATNWNAVAFAEDAAVV